MGRNFRILLIWALIHSQIFCLLLLFWEFCYIRKWIVTFIIQIAQTYWTYYLVELTNFSLLGIGLSFQEGNFYTMLSLNNKERILSACHVHNLILVDTQQKIFAFTNNWQMKVRKELWSYVLHMHGCFWYRVTQDILLINQSECFINYLSVLVFVYIFQHLSNSKKMNENRSKNFYIKQILH